MPTWSRFREFKRQLLCHFVGVRVRMLESPEKSTPTLKSVTALKSSPTLSAGRANAAKKFSGTGDYKLTLNRLKVEFEKRYSNPKVSSEARLEDYDVLKTLGTGAFGVVKLIRKKNTEQYFAMKVLSKEKIVRLKQLTHTLNEKRILQSVDFPFLVNLECCYKDNSFIYLAMPFISGGEMFSLLRKSKRFGEDQVRFYGAQVALALEYLHHMNLVYRDLKPENILIDTKGYVKITDFGFCKIVKDRTWTLCGTPEYLAPEIIQSKGYGKTVDWWSYGILLYEMVAGYAPFYSRTGDQIALFERICKGRVRYPTHVSSELRSLIQNLLQVDITKRYGNMKNGTTDIKQHVWFRTTNWIMLLNGDITAPFIPQVSGPGDASQFEIYDEQDIKVASKCLFIKEFADF